MHVKDQLENSLIFERTPKRIISLVPSQTELLADLELSSHIVGVTKFCVHPLSIKKESTVVGGTKYINFKKIESLKPDIIICNKEENTKEIVAFCQSIAPTWVSDIYTIEDNIKMIQSFGELFDKNEVASRLVLDLRQRLADFKQFIADKPVKKVGYLIWKKPYMLAGQHTFINELLRLNNFENCALPNTRYPEISIEELKNVDLVLLSSEPFPFKEKNITELKSVLQTEIRLVDGEYFSWYGSRIINAFDYFKTLH